jgi:RNA polymerase sigma-70 factor (ECF subfamily)
VVREEDLVAQAVGGDIAALEQLLLGHYDRLAAEIGRKLPAELRGTVTADDVLQEAFIIVFREIAGFQPRGPESFSAWLATIAEHRLLDLIKAQRRAKRGGGRVAVDAYLASPDGSLVALFEQIQGRDGTPSRSAASREALSALRIGLAGLKDEYRQALGLRYLEGLPVAEVAARMQRSEHAIHMLCHRGLEQLRQVLGRSSRFFTRK